MDIVLPYTLLAIDNKETVLAGATLVAGAPTPEATAQGLLDNDYLIFSDGSLGSASFPTVSVYDISISGTVYLAQAFISDSYGDWSFFKEGVYHFIANGISAKKLADGELATIVLPYTIASDNGETDQANLIIDLIGRYDPIEASVTGPFFNKQVTETNWLTENQFSILTGQGKKWFGPTIQLDFQDNNSNIVFDGFVKELKSTGLDGRVTSSSAIGNFLNGEIVFGVEAGLVPDTYRPYFQINTDNFSLLNEGEALEIVLATSVSDGVGTPLIFDLGSITLFGQNNAPYAHDDLVTLITGQLVAADVIEGVLANDFDADSQHTLQVTGAGYGAAFEEIDPALPTNSVTLQGTYSTLQLFRDGFYFVHDNGRYSDARTPWTAFTEIFTYRIQDDRGAPGATEGQLIVNVLPSSESRVVQSLLSSVVQVSEDDGDPVPVLDGWKSIHLNLEPIRAFSKANDVSDLNLVFFSVADSNPLHASQTLDPSKLSLLGTSISLLPTLNVVQVPDPTQGTVWRADLNVDAHLLSNTDPYLASLLGFSLDMLNKGEQVELTYSLAAGGATLDQHFIKIVITGENDAPILTELSEQLYAGQTVARDASQGLLSQAFDIDSADQIHLVHIQADSVDPLAPGVHTAEIAPGNIVIINGLYGSLIVQSDGSYHYAANQEAAQAIAPGVQAFDIFTYVVDDLNGGVSSAQLKIRVFSPQDLPSPMADDFMVALDGLSADNPVANVLDNDGPLNPGAMHVSWNFDGTAGVIGDENGNLYIDPASFESLKHGESQAVEFFYTISNDLGDTAPTPVVIHVVGSNEAPVASSDTYVYENRPGSVMAIAATDGLLGHHDAGETEGDTDADGDTLALSALLAEEGGDPVSLVNGQATLLKDGVTIIVQANGQFTVDAPDDFTGVVSFAYEVSDGLATDTATAYIDIGGPATLAGRLIVNEISLDTGPVVRIVRTDNGAAPDSIKVGAASIELFNNSDQTITAAELASVTLQIKGADGAISTVDFSQLTGLTADKNGEALSKLILPAHGVLMIYEPGGSGNSGNSGDLSFGTWALYKSGATPVFISSGSYQGSAWELGSNVTEDLALNLSQNETSIDFFAANGADIDGFHGVVGIADTASPGVPWEGADLGSTVQTTQFNASLSSDKETVFSRVDYFDSNDASDWSTTTRAGLTIGNVNLKGTVSSPTFIANPLDPLESLNQMQGTPSTEGQLALVSSDGSEDGGDSADILIGGSQNDTLDGLGHNDYLEGNGGNDVLLGGAGGDRLSGGAGDDELYGGTGQDDLTGGDGHDRFVYVFVKESNGLLADEISDFQHGEDKIDLSGIDANIRITGNQVFAWGGNALQAKANTVSWHEEGGMTIVTADVTVDTVADFRIVLHGVGLQLQATDFIL